MAYRKQSKQMASAASTAQSVVIAQPKQLTVALEIAGTADLIQNNFGQKNIEEMLRKHMGLSVQKEKKNPRECIRAATIFNTDGHVCIPPVAFKAAMLSASIQVKTLKKTQLRPALFIEGQSIPITYSKMTPRMDIVRLAGIVRQPDVRFRPSFENWKARMLITFSDTLSVQTVVDLLNRAGSIGVGEWRPEKNGVFGTFQVVRNITDEKELSEVRDSCSVPLVKPVIPEWALDHDIDPEMLRKAFGEIGEANGAAAV